MTPDTKWKIKLSIALTGTLAGLSLFVWSVWYHRHDLKVPTKPQMTTQQEYDLGYVVGQSWASAPPFNQGLEEASFARGFFAGMNSVLAHIEFQTNKPHMVLELTNVLEDLDRLQKSNAVLRHVVRTNK